MNARRIAEPRWHVPIALDEIPETGKRVELAPDAAAREAIARSLGLAALPRLEAVFDLARHGRDGLHLVGRVSATVGQTCVVTLEPVANEVEEAIDLVFLPPSLPQAEPSDRPLSIAAEEPPEQLHDGTVDLAAVALEFLLLGIDPYPRRPGVRFDAPPAGDPKAHPFAALAALKKGPGGKGR
jgi:uncharacterized metal-binding protein YceD (DUF177 family)